MISSLGRPFWGIELYVRFMKIHEDVYTEIKSLQHIDRSLVVIVIMISSLERPSCWGRECHVFHPKKNKIHYNSVLYLHWWCDLTITKNNYPSLFFYFNCLFLSVSLSSFYFIFYLRCFMYAFHYKFKLYKWKFILLIYILYLSVL